MPRKWPKNRKAYTGPVYADGKTLIPLSNPMTDSSLGSDSDSNSNSGGNSSSGVCKNTNVSNQDLKPFSKGIVKPSEAKEVKAKKEEKKKKLEKVVTEKTKKSPELIEQLRNLCDRASLDDLNTFERIVKNYRRNVLNKEFRVGDQVVFTAGRGRFHGRLISGTVARVMTKNIVLEDCSTADEGSPKWKVTASLLKHTWKHVTEQNELQQSFSDFQYKKNETSDEDSN